MKIKRILSTFLVLAMMVGVFPATGLTVSAKDANTITQDSNSATMTVSVTVPEKEPVSYIDADGTEKQTGFTNGSKTIEDYIYINNEAYRNAYIEQIWTNLKNQLLEYCQENPPLPICQLHDIRMPPCRNGQFAHMDGTTWCHLIQRTHGRYRNRLTR